MRLRELLLTLLLVAAAAWAVLAQMGSAPTDAPAVAAEGPLLVGEALDPDLRLAGLDGDWHRVGDRLGEVATVFYSWSTACPCVPICDPRMRPLFDRWGPEQGVRWVAVVGEPADTPAVVRTVQGELDAFYDTLLDPGQLLCRRIGFDQAALIAVVDGDGYLRFRGNPDDDLRTPVRHHLAEALPRIVAGERPPNAEPEIAYGCGFSDPAPDCDAPEPDSPSYP